MSYLSECYREAADERDSYREDYKDTLASLRQLYTDFILTLKDIQKMSSRGKTKELDDFCTEVIENLHDEYKKLI